MTEKKKDPVSSQYQKDVEYTVELLQQSKESQETKFSHLNDAYLTSAKKHLYNEETGEYEYKKLKKEETAKAFAKDVTQKLKDVYQTITGHDLKKSKLKGFDDKLLEAYFGLNSKYVERLFVDRRDELTSGQFAQEMLQHTYQLKRQEDNTAVQHITDRKHLDEIIKITKVDSARINKDDMEIDHGHQMLKTYVTNEQEMPTKELEKLPFYVPIEKPKGKKVNMKNNQDIAA